MNYLAETYLNYEPVKIETLIGKRGIKQLTMRQADPAKVCEYAAEDADITLQLESYLFDELEKVGFHRSDVRALENLSDPRVLEALPGARRYLQKNVREDVILYFETYANLLEEQDLAPGDKEKLAA